MPNAFSFCGLQIVIGDLLVIFRLKYVRRISGRVFVERLENAYRILQERHEILRTNFRVIDNVPRQVVNEFPMTSFVFRDLSANPQTYMELVRRESGYVFDLETESLIRLTLIRLGEEEYILILNMQHLIIDGWSCGILLDELTALYRSFVRKVSFVLPELAVQYRDYAAWYNTVLSSGS